MSDSRASDRMRFEIAAPDVAESIRLVRGVELREGELPFLAADDLLVAVTGAFTINVPLHASEVVRTGPAGEHPAAPSSRSLFGPVGAPGLLWMTEQRTVVSILGGALLASIAIMHPTCFLAEADNKDIDSFRLQRGDDDLSFRFEISFGDYSIGVLADQAVDPKSGARTDLERQVLFASLDMAATTVWGNTTTAPAPGWVDCGDLYHFFASQ